MRQSTMDQWLPIILGYNPKKWKSQAEYCRSIGVDYGKYKVYKSRMIHGQKSYSKVSSRLDHPVLFKEVKIV